MLHTLPGSRNRRRPKTAQQRGEDLPMEMGAIAGGAALAAVVVVTWGSAGRFDAGVVAERIGAVHTERLPGKARRSKH